MVLHTGIRFEPDQAEHACSVYDPGPIASRCGSGPKNCLQAYVNRRKTPVLLIRLDRNGLLGRPSVPLVEDREWFDVIGDCSWRAKTAYMLAFHVSSVNSWTFPAAFAPPRPVLFAIWRRRFCRPPCPNMSKALSLTPYREPLSSSVG